MDPVNLKEKDWSYDHFTAFLLIYAAYADYVYDHRERELILRYVSEKVVQECEEHFDRIGGFEQLQLVMKLKDKYVKSAVDITLLKAMLDKLFRSDGEYSKAESYQNDFLERILNFKDH